MGRANENTSVNIWITTNGVGQDISERRRTMLKHTIRLENSNQIDRFEVEIELADNEIKLLDYWAIEEFDEYDFDLVTGVIRARIELKHHIQN